MSRQRALNEVSAGARETEEAWAESTACFGGIISSATDAIVCIDAAQRIVLFNRAAERMFEVSASEVLGRSIDRFIPERFRGAHTRYVVNFGRTGVSTRSMGALGRISGLRANGKEFPLEASISQVEVRTRKLFTLILRDITERQRAEEDLRESEARYRSLVEVSRDAIFIAQKNRFVFANQAGLRLFRAPRPEQVIGKSVFEFAHPDYHVIIRRRLRHMLELGRPSPMFEEKIVRLDGTVCDVEVAACPFPDRGGISIQVVMHDVAEDRLLERGILSAVEQEQKRMGRDLHDGLCQLLTATKFQLTLLEHKLKRKSLVEAGEARALERQINQAIEQAHGLAQGLNPVKLVAQGLMSALEELATGVESAFRLRCVCDFPKPVPVRDHTMANHLYRIAQEAVQNAVKHGKARTVRIELKELGRCIELRVEDDGVGLPRRPRRKAGMGLQNMKARAGMIGASLDIRPRKQGGTVVTCRLRGPAEKSKR
jgi:PAS domain S-box-containing protein